ncbi:FliH/SctL family protein [Spartinivicinus ruber]|uniref:FliH/SctL family protein n=1 Tax=Spartinivicinus ruber TaxID=2683272 RepID=UPI0013D628F5|nr:hypothetical protein [Spartinivicinus ruber]
MAQIIRDASIVGKRQLLEASGASGAQASVNKSEPSNKIENLICENNQLVEQLALLQQEKKQLQTENATLQQALNEYQQTIVRDRQQAEHEGYQAGHEKGLDIATNEVNQQFEVQLRHLEAATELLKKQLKVEQAKLDEKIVSQALLVISHLAGKLYLNEDFFIHWVKTSLQQISTNKKITVLLSQVDFQRINPVIEQIQAQLSPLNIEWQVDQTKPTGELHFIADYGCWKLSYKEQLEQLEQLLE